MIPVIHRSKKISVGFVLDHNIYIPIDAQFYQWPLRIQNPTIQ